MALYIKLKEGNKCKDIIKDICEKYKSYGRLGGDFIWVDETGDFTVLIEGEDYWGNSVYTQKAGNAWMRFNPNERKHTITCGIIGRKGLKMSRRTYAQYHSALMNVFLTYYDEKIEDISVSPMPDKKFDFCNESVRKNRTDAEL